MRLKRKENVRLKIQQMNKFENIKDMDQNSLIFMYTHEDIITPIIVHIKVSTPEQLNLDLN